MADSKDPFLQVAAGQPVFREGDLGSEMYIIESGIVDILRSDRSNEPLATLEAGDFFGEMAVLEDQPRFATAMARTNVRLLRIDRAAFGDVVAQNIEIAIRIMRKLTARLRRSEQRASEALAALDDLRKRLTQREAARAAEPAQAPARATSAAGWSLVHPGSGAVFPLVGQAEFLVGRPDPVTGINPEINLGPYDVTRSLSRRHAKIVVNASGAIELREDVGTTNGTFVNGERIRTGVPIALKHGDRVRFGSVETIVQ